MSKASPVKPQSRLEFVDILRGFALIGVLTANLVAFSGYSSNPGDYADFLDQVILIGIQFFVRAKFYTLFSFLFGWGMSVQMLRAADKGIRFVPVFARRMAILLLFGLVHGMLIWHGDILTLYAVLGFVLLLFRKRSERTLLITAVLFLLLPIALTLPGETMDALRSWYAQSTVFMRQGNLPDAIFATGTYGEIVPKTAQEYWEAQSWTLYFIGSVFSMFLLGLYVGKRQILQNVDQHLPLIKRTLLIGLAVGVIFNAIFVWNTLHPAWVAARYGRFVGVGSRAIGAPGLMLFYTSGLILLTRRQIWLERLRPLGNLGRMALSNYLLQSIIFVFIFYGFGLGLYGQTDPTFGLILTVLVLMGQIRYSGWHLNRYQFGPMEWLWRTLTYGRRQKWRVTDGEALAASYKQQVASGKSRIHPLVRLVIVWVVLILWAGGLLFWYRDLGSGSGFSLELAAQATATPVPEQVAVQTDAENEPEAVATPQVKAVSYDPGRLAQTGDMSGLAQTFDPEQALEEIEELSGAPYAGRRAGSTGGLAAGDYLAQQFSALGLQPAGEAGTFFQTFPISYTNLAEAPHFVLTLPDDDREDGYSLHQDYAPIIHDFVGEGRGSGDVVWMNRCTHEDFGQINVVDKVVLCQPEGSREAFLQANRSAVEHGAAGLLLATTAEQRPPDMGDRFLLPWIPEPIPALRVYARLVDDLFLGSGVTITESLLLDEPLSLVTHVDLAVETLGNQACSALTPGDGCMGRNVLAVLPGRDPQFASEVLILGAHYDHLGDSPSDGLERTVWAGANDNASGTAVLLEIARSWQEEGYVPRRTVLFAGWDAEELGLLGSIHYVYHPQYPLDNIVAMLQLDMVGAGGDFLNGDGSDEIVAQLRTAAEGMDLPLHQIRLGRSDHVPFIEAGVPAAALIWLDENGKLPSHYHRPADTLEVIELHKLEQVGELAALMVLNLAESEPALLALVKDRAAALMAGDQEAFLATSTAGQSGVDRTWFADLQARDPLTVTIAMDNLQIGDKLATAETSISAVYPLSDTLHTVEGSLTAQFTRQDDGWRWAGPHLQPGSEDIVTVSYPAGLEDDLSGLPAAVRDQYAEIAGALGIPANTPFELQLFPNGEALRSSTALFMEEEEPWVGAGLVRMIYEAGLVKEAANNQQPTEDGKQLTEEGMMRVEEELVRLALANEGVDQEAETWLWMGLPLAWRAREDGVGVQSVFLPLLHEALANELPVPENAAAWAAADYALEQVGWDGVLHFAPSEAWRGDWERRLTEVQTELDSLLAQRTKAILAQDEGRFLETAVPELAAAQRRWLADLDQRPLNSFMQTAVPLAFLEDGSVLARVTMAYELSGRGPSTAEMAIRFIPGEAHYLWAGKWLQELPGSTAIVRYPDGYEEAASAVQEKADAWVPELAAMFALSPTLPLEIELYDGFDDMRAAIALPYPATNWTEPGQAIKLQAEAGDDVLANQLARQLLVQAGVEQEWLLRGVPAFLSARFDGGVTQRSLALDWPDLNNAASAEGVQLADFALQLEMSQADDALAQVAAWDAVRTYVHEYGWPALAEQMGGGRVAVPLAEFQEEWSDSLARGHIRPEWVDMVSAFDAGAAVASVELLAGKDLAGRLAGTPGADSAAAAIAGAFRDAGLQPAGENGTFMQTVPITTSQVIDPIRLELQPPAAGTVSFIYRDDFLPVQPTEGGEPVSGPLFFVQEGAEYGEIDFNGGIVVRRPELSAGEEMRRAQEHGAGGLILIGVKREDADRYGKRPDMLLPTAEIPVLELTQDGTSKLLTALELDRAALHRLEPVQALEADMLLHYALTPPQQGTASNVLALLPGSDPLLGQETIILGAHYDYVGDDGDGRRYGGENEATGPAALIEIARMWQEAGYEPQRTILFAAWGGQEIGSAGSQFYVSDPAWPLADTVALVQIEGVGGGKGISLGAQGDEASDGWLMSGMETAVAQLDGKVVLTPVTTPSDQASFADQGFPTLLISWRLAGDDNLSTEVGYKVDPDNVQFAGQSAALLVMSLAQ